MNIKFDKTIIYENDPTATIGRVEEYMQYYPIKSAIAYLCKPKRIAEIGVRCGYSAYSFLQACPGAYYHGFDANNGTHGGKGGQDGKFKEHALKVLRAAEFYHNAKCDYSEMDTQKLKELPGAPYDFVHVDGDHSFEGCLHDLRIAIKSLCIGGYVLIDDYDYIETVKAAVDRYIYREDEFTGIEYIRDDCEMIYFPSLRGEILMRKKI